MPTKPGATRGRVSDEAAHSAWLGEPITIRKATPAKSLRITWTDGVSNADRFLWSGGDRAAHLDGNIRISHTSPAFGTSQR